MKFLLGSLQLLVFASVVGCSHTRETKNETGQFTDEQVEQMNREALAIASSRLEKIVQEAKSNSTAARYLGTDLFLKGNMSLMSGDYLTASVLFKHLVELEPNDEFIQKKYAVSLIKMGDLEGSEPVLATLYARGGEEKVGLILAGVYTGLDKEDKARQLYLKILARNPKSEDACVFLGKSYATTKQTDRALRILNECARRDPKNGMYDYYVGKIHVDNGHLEKGLTAFKKAFERQPSLSQAVSAIGILYEEVERWDEAIKVYKRYLKASPADRTILARLVQALFTKEQYAEVIPFAEQLADLEPENLNLKVKLGVLYSDAKKYDEAVSIFKELLVHAPGSDKILYYLGAIHQELSQYQEAIEYFTQIPENSGLYTDSSVQVANMLSSLAQQDEKYRAPFLAHVNRALEQFKDFRVEFSVIKSGYFESMGQFKDAMEAMMVVQDLEGFSNSHKYYLANLYEKEKRYDDSTSLIMGIIKAEPKNAHAWNFLGYAMLLRGEDMPQAFEYIQKAVSLNPEDGYIRDSLGWYYYKTGDTKRALTELEVALKKVPDDIEILKHLGEIHLSLRNIAKARDFFQAALKQARYHSDRREIMVALEEVEKNRLPASGKND